MLTVLVATGYERVIWGGYIPGAGPERANFNDRRYYPRSFQEHVGDHDLRLMIGSYYWGRRLYVRKDSYRAISVEHKYHTYMEIFIKNADGTFQALMLSGGP